MRYVPSTLFHIEKVEIYPWTSSCVCILWLSVCILFYCSNKIFITLRDNGISQSVTACSSYIFAHVGGLTHLKMVVLKLLNSTSAYSRRGKKSTSISCLSNQAVSSSLKWEKKNLNFSVISHFRNYSKFLSLQ